MATLFSQASPRYGSAYLGRGLFVALLVPMTVIALQWRTRVDVDMPEFMVVWFSCWLFSLVITMVWPLPRWSSYVLHWCAYVAAFGVFIYEWRVACMLQGFASLLWWSLFDAFERMYANYKSANESLAQAKVLEARIRPHFVFNVLNSLRALSPAQSLVAKGLDDGADLLRAALVRTGTFVAYDEERALVEQYLRLEALRLQERLQVEWRVDDDVEDYNPMVPGFILQPIVENAIRHGVEACGGMVFIELSRVKSYLVVVVTNRCCAEGGAANAGQGLGLAEQDVRARLRLLYDSHADYCREFTDGTCRVTIRFPWRLQ